MEAQNDLSDYICTENIGKVVKLGKFDNYKIQFDFI